LAEPEAASKLPEGLLEDTATRQPAYGRVAAEAKEV